jgi:ABC-type Fe2+-enterobactin transport system substrate-binding protein
MMKDHALTCCIFMIFLAVSGCNDVKKATQVPSKTSANSWPRTIDTPKGKLVLPKAPQRIVSTSVTLTGSLLTINAPVIASAATVHMNKVTDQSGFFTQWSSIAQQRNVIPLYQGETNAEAILALSPDLIVVAATGGDSALKAYEQLSQIAPTLVINYDDKSWEEVSTILGQTTGHEVDAQTAIDAFNKHLASVKQQIHVPQQPVTAMVYYDDDSGANLWTKNSAQGRLLEKLGFTLATMPDSLKNQSVALGRKDIIPVSGERFSEALTGHSLIVFAGDDATTKKVIANKFLRQHPAIEHSRVYAVGIDTFRLDYFSASHFLDRMAHLFS